MLLKVSEIGSSQNITIRYLPKVTRRSAFEWLYFHILLASRRTCTPVTKLPHGDAGKNETHRIVFGGRGVLRGSTRQLTAYASYEECLLLELLFGVHERLGNRALELAQGYFAAPVVYKDELRSGLTLYEKHKIIMRVLAILLVSPKAEVEQINTLFLRSLEEFLDGIDATTLVSLRQ